MMPTRWTSLADVQSEMNRLRQEMDRLFGRLGVGNRPWFAPAAYPPVNMWEDDDRVYVEAELPGMELSDLEIYVTENNQLTISGERKEPSGEQGAWHRRERGYGKFTRTLDLPCPVDADRVEARLRQGVLTVTLPKREDSKPRRIEVKGE